MDRLLELGEEVGRGALGRVVRVRDRESGEILAGKILHPSHRGDPRALARFEGEADLAARVRHPNLVEIRGIADVGGERALLMELVEGPSLAEVIAAEGPLDSERIIAIGRGIAAGLGAAHRAGLVHRDLKPQNVLLASGDVPKIVDFGLARAASFEGVDPSAFAVVGTPDYIAPESIDPLAVDPRSDLYSLGCILYEMAAGRPPFGGATALAILEAHQIEPVPPLERPEGDDLAPGLASLIEHLLAKSPADRPQSARVVELALEELGASGGALVPASHASPAAAQGRCADCGDPLIAAIPICFRCGMEQASLSKGRFSLFVTGPGEAGDKLDAELRQALLDWLDANPALGFDTAALARRVPRVPFVVATRVSEESARRLGESLEKLGLECGVSRGNRFSLPAMRRKAWTLSGRILAIIGLSTMYFWHRAVSVLPMLFVGGLGAVSSGWFLAGRRVVHRRKRLGSGAPLEIEGALHRVAGVLPAVSHRRHRESLRAVVERAIALGGRPGVRAEDVAQVIDLATVAASRLDELETELAGADLRNPDEATRERLRARDLCAGRLLELAGQLDALRVRVAALATGEGEEDDELAELRAYVEALEEVEAL